MPSDHRTSCDWVLERIDPFLDGELGHEESAEVEAHAEACPDCAAELALARDVVASLHALERHPCPPGLVARAESMAREAAERGLLARIAGWLAPRFDVLRRPAMAAMIVVVVAAGAFVILQRDAFERNGGDYTQAEIEAAARDARIAFAYVGRYSRRTGRLLRDDVIDKRVIPTMQRAMGDSREEVVDKRIVPVVERAVMDALFIETLERMRRPNQ